MKAKLPTTMEFETHQTIVLGNEVLRDPRAPYHAASCMFALHYFCTTETSLRTFLETVSVNLVNGGYFFGCIPDGKAVLDCLASSGGTVYHDGMLTIRQYWEGQPQCFGSGFAISIEDTVVEGATTMRKKGWRAVWYTSSCVGLLPVFTHRARGRLHRGQLRVPHLFQRAAANCARVSTVSRAGLWCCTKLVFAGTNLCLEA